MSLSLIVVGKSYAECADFYERNKPSHPDVGLLPVSETILLDNGNGRYGGLGHIWNSYFKDPALRGTTIGMVHADTALSKIFLENVLFQTEVVGAVAGIVGRSIKGFYVWSEEQEKAEPVSTLDGCSVFVSRKTVLQHNLRFDTHLFDSFHCCVEDFCLSAAHAGVPIVVPPGPAGHIGLSTKNSEWLREYWIYRRRLEEKYPDTIFKTT